MKLAHKLCGAALLAAVGVALAIPSTTKALEDPSAKGDMDIQFTRKTDGSVDPKHPGESGTASVTWTYKNFGVVGVTPLQFGEAEATATERSFWAKNWSSQPGHESQNYVLINDDRNVADHSYTVSAAITSDLKPTDGPQLTGSQIVYSNMNIYSEADDAIKLPESALGTKTATVSSTKTPVVTNTDKTKGQGQTHIRFGTRNTADDTDSTKSVRLDIDKSQTVVEGKYKGEITWTMEATPTPVAP